LQPAAIEPRSSAGTFTPAHQDYVNERNVNWGYDADGNLTDSSDVQYTIEAAGRTSRTVSSTENTYKDPNAEHLSQMRL